MRRGKTVKVRLDGETAAWLQKLVGNEDLHGDVESVLRHLAQSAADGLQRPGSWERQWLSQAFVLPTIEKVDPNAPWRMAL